MTASMGRAVDKKAERCAGCWYVALAIAESFADFRRRAGAAESDGRRHVSETHRQFLRGLEQLGTAEAPAKFYAKDNGLLVFYDTSLLSRTTVGRNITTGCRRNSWITRRRSS